MEKAYAKFGDQFEAIAIADIVSDSFSAAFKDVDAVIHTASPIPHRAPAEDILKVKELSHPVQLKIAHPEIQGAEEGTINVIRQAQEAGIKKFVVTSSMATVAHPKSSFTDKGWPSDLILTSIQTNVVDWNPVTREDALKGDGLHTYQAAKTLAELALWEFADQHREIDITTCKLSTQTPTAKTNRSHLVNPTFLYGPLASGFSLPEPNYAALSSDFLIYHLITPGGSYPPSATYLDVRDAARAHINALTSPPEASVGRKRIVMASPFENKFERILELIARKRPELASRLTTTAVPSYPVYKAPIDLQRVQDVVGIKIDSYKSWEDTFLDTIDSLVELEKQWKAAGHIVNVPKA